MMSSTGGQREILEVVWHHKGDDPTQAGIARKGEYYPFDGPPSPIQDGRVHQGELWRDQNGILWFIADPTVE